MRLDDRPLGRTTTRGDWSLISVLTPLPPMVLLLDGPANVPSGGGWVKSNNLQPNRRYLTCSASNN